MRAMDIDTSGKIWVYTPSTHKTSYFGHNRFIYLGPQAQKIARPFLANRPFDAYLFSPKEAELDREKAIEAMSLFG